MMNDANGNRIDSIVPFVSRLHGAMAFVAVRGAEPSIGYIVDDVGLVVGWVGAPDDYFPTLADAADILGFDLPDCLR